MCENNKITFFTGNPTGQHTTITFLKKFSINYNWIYKNLQETTPTKKQVDKMEQNCQKHLWNKLWYKRKL